MPDTSGPTANKLVSDLGEWAAQRRQFYIEALSQGGPYGSVKLSPQEQIQRFLQATPIDYEAMIEKLNMKYMGLPDAQNRVNTDLTNYIRRMIVLLMSKGQISDQEFNSQQQQIQQDIAPGSRFDVGGQ